MKYLKLFLTQKVPASDRKLMPQYYRTALQSSERLLGAYFFAVFVLNCLVLEYCSPIPAAMGAAALFMGSGRIRFAPRISLLLHSFLSVLWCAWSVYVYGWGADGQLCLAHVLVLLFFSVFETPAFKLAGFAFIVVFRIALHSFSGSAGPAVVCDGAAGTFFQILNSVVMYMLLCLCCLLFSTNTHKEERELILNNQKLRKEADTDPLTQLLNRRPMLEDIAMYRMEFPNAWFSVAIADIDHFKAVNDTYGHNCGDAVLKALADHFRERAGDRYVVCRWGGEEFFFFLPRQNLDGAGQIITEICAEVEKMQIVYEDNVICITVTAGVEEYDFGSDLDTIIGRADDKLYMGKKMGRNRVVL